MSQQGTEGTEGPPAGAGPAFGEGPPPKADQETPDRDLRPLAEEMRGIVGADHVYTHEHQLSTYASDGLLQYAVIPGMVVLPADAQQVQRSRRLPVLHPMELLRMSIEGS